MNCRMANVFIVRSRRHNAALAEQGLTTLRSQDMRQEPETIASLAAQGTRRVAPAQSYAVQR